MNSINRVSLAGNLTRDPELRKTSNGNSVADLGLALNRSWLGPDGERNEEVLFVDVSVWGKTAENAVQYLSKGRAVFIEGRLKLDHWQDAKTGEPRSKLGVVAERVHYLDSPGNSRSGQSGDRDRQDRVVDQAESSTPGPRLAHAATR